MTAAVSAPTQTISELRAWLTAAEEALWAMTPLDPRYAKGLEIWQARHDEYLARALVEEAVE